MAQLAQSLLVTGGPRPPQAWDRPRRSSLVANLGPLVNQLNRVGITDIFIDGSFATDKGAPGDIDGYFITDLLLWSQQLRMLAALDPTWTYDLADRLPDHAGKLKWPQWHRYRIELFPVFRPPYDYASFMGTDTPPITIDAFFRSDRDHHPRGLVQILPGDQS